MQKTLEAEPMLQCEAEAKLGREIANTSKDDMGFLTCDMETLQWDWVPETSFRGKPCETAMENVFLFQGAINDWATFFRQYTKANRGMSQEERLQVYQINKHLKAIKTIADKILNINIINKNISEL